MKSYKFNSLSLESKKDILLDLINHQFSFSHILQNNVRNLIEAKEKYQDDKWYQYDEKEFLDTGLISKIEYNNGIIKLDGLLGNFVFYSLCNSSIQNSSSTKISSLSDFQSICFSNVIDMLELNKKGKIVIIQISSATNTYLHAVFIDNQIVYDLNYWMHILYNNYKFYIIVSL